MTIAGVVGAARYGASVALDEAPEIRERMAKSRSVLVGKVQAGKSVYGISTGLGGSGTCHTLFFLTRIAQLKAPYDPCRTLVLPPTGYSGHAYEPHDRPRARAHTASPHWRAAVRRVPPGPASCASAVRPACGNKHARGVGTRRDPCAPQLAHPRPLSCALGTT